jgi:signal transduction histidine kinase
VEPTGLTDFKKVSEYVIAAAFILAAVLVARRGTELSVVSRQLLVAAMLTSAAAEILFTLYVGVYAFPNLLGHLLMFVSVYLIYRGVVVSGLACTYKQVVEKLDERTAELEALSRNLELRVEERTSELNVAVAELETISYSISHELRSPLRAIDGFSLLALEEGRDTLDPQTVQSLERVRAAAQHMGHLIDDLLDIMKISSLQANREHIDLSALATDVAADVAAAHPDRHVRLEVEPRMTARADPTLVAVVMRNLLSNAYKFTSRSEDPAVSVSTEPGPGPTRYSVRDNGVGLDVEQAGKVFEPFHRLVRQDEFEGTGVGLAIVRRIVLLHGGRIGIDGDPGRGATVWFTLEPNGAPAERSGS